MRANLDELSQEKALINEGKKALGDMTKSITEKLGMYSSRSTQREEFSVVQVVGKGIRVIGWKLSDYTDSELYFTSPHPIFPHYKCWRR